MLKFNNFGFCHWGTRQILSVIMLTIIYNNPQYCDHFLNHGVTKPCLKS